MIAFLIIVLIFVVGGLGYTLDVNLFAAIGILIGLLVLCGFIGYFLSKRITKNPQQTLQKAQTLNMFTVPSLILGIILWIVGFSNVSDSAKVVATSQRHLLFKTVVTPSSLTLIGTFVILLGITFWMVASPHLPPKQNDKK